MKKTILGTVVCLGALIGLGSKPAAAQMVDSVKVTLPFAASVGGVTLPAGDYMIRNIQGDGGSSVLQISSRNTSVDALAMQVIAPKNQGSDETKVVLKQSANGYKIQSVWIQGQELGYEFLSAE